MNIAIIAHDKKKELMSKFCIAYCSILSKHDLISTSITGRQIAEATGLNIHCFLSGQQGGVQQIASRISYNEIDLLIFFRDPLSADSYLEQDEINMLRLCDVHNVPAATNLGTAEVLVRALERGDLDWRDIVNPKK